MTLEIEKELLERLIENSRALADAWAWRRHTTRGNNQTMAMLDDDIAAAESLIQSPDKSESK